MHWQLGYVWVALMVLVVVSGFLIHEIRVIGVFSPIHLLSLFVLITVFTAVSAEQNGPVSQHRKAMVMLYIFGLLLA